MDISKRIQNIASLRLHYYTEVSQSSLTKGIDQVHRYSFMRVDFSVRVCLGVCVCVCVDVALTLNI